MPDLSIHRGRHRPRGQSLVELALILPVLLLLMLTAIDLGRILYSQITVTNAAKEGALVASQGGTFVSGQGCSDTNSVMCGVLTEAQGGMVEVDLARVALTPALCEKNAMWPANGSPPVVTVSVQAPFRVLTPIIGNIIGNNLLLTATADAQCLVVPRVTYPQVPEPVAAFTANPTSGTAPLSVNVDASASYSTGATITTYTWNCAGCSGPVTSTTYNTAGTFAITLTVTDSRGATDTESQTITVTGGGGPPPPTCPTVDIIATNTSNNGNPHRMNVEANLTASSAGWAFAWIFASTAWPGAPPQTGQANNVNFPSAGPYVVTVLASKGTCVLPPYTETVVAP